MKVVVVPFIIYVVIQILSYWIAPMPKDWSPWVSTREQKRTPEGREHLKKMRRLDVVAFLLIVIWLLIVQVYSWCATGCSID